mmetsp:Transcript_11189/g.25064  ORF Transcript_11189/g.25064 Transcript_11189/m.25064 type:complete len:337 (-) Transcript_11189:105-1115(-)|eukprot:CAMPEP_0170587814 /NCGR_PEP_ID=MMETSP0224-20130122/10485_1 /TAXON_ID=285029 /ORGANISM="Togula jolla, Strain CCCM 725" /LENGTH=336 /DNA_ID=CAMNT_0010911465 /DNA_START=41 /DNA_END=1051 /DNA_ORIENTATION=+
MAQVVGSPQQVSVTVPDGVTEGMNFLAQMPDGSHQSVIVPPGVKPGESLLIEAATVPPDAGKLGAFQSTTNLARNVSSTAVNNPCKCSMTVCTVIILIGGAIAAYFIIDNHTGCSQYDYEDCMMHSGGDRLCAWPEDGECGCVGDSAGSCPVGGGSGGGTSGGSFVAGTLVQIRDGWQRIEDLRIDDEVALGGRVVARMEFMAFREETFLYRGAARTSIAKPIVVAGGHAVFDGKRWMRVRDAPGASPIDDETWQSLLRPGETFLRVYDVDVEHHRLSIRSGETFGSDEVDMDGIVFSDFSEVDPDHPLVENFEESLLGALSDAAARSGSPPDLAV